MLFSNLTLPNPLPNITLNDYFIEHVDSTLFLGLTIDSKLKFGDHVHIISSKIAKSIGIIKHIANLIPVSTLLSLYYALIHPYLIYAALAWGSTYEVHLKPIIILQKKAIRAINKVHFLSHTTPLFFSNRILKFLDLIKYRQAIHVYCNFNSYIPIVHNHGTRNRDNLVPPYCRLTLTQHSLSYNAPSFWNTIPLEIREAGTLAMFKKHLKDYLISKYN